VIIKTEIQKIVYTKIFLLFEKVVQGDDSFLPISSKDNHKRFLTLLKLFHIFSGEPLEALSVLNFQVLKDPA